MCYIGGSDITDCVITSYQYYVPEQICFRAFQYSKNLQSIYLDNSVKLIDSYAFDGCNADRIIIANPNCQINLDYSTLGSKDIVIYGYRDSTAEEYAEKTGHRFEEIGAACIGTEHSFKESVIQSATCVKSGKSSFVCERCGEFYKENIPATGIHMFVDGACTVCGAKDPRVQRPEIKSAQLRLNDDINMIYATELPEDFESPYMVFNFHGQEFTVDSYTVNSDGQYCFEFTDINPQCMGDNISATLYATKDGETVSVSKADYSVRQYCINQLAKTEDAKLITLLSDLLTYGAAAQVYTGYKTNTLVTDGLDLTPSTFDAISGKNVSFTGEQDSHTYWTSASLVLSNDLATRFIFATDSTDGLTVEVSINGRTQTYTEFADLGNGKYFITFDGIKATEFDDIVIARFLRNGEQIGATVNYSVNTYICGTQNVDNANLQALVRALYNYGVSAKAYSKAQ